MDEEQLALTELEKLLIHIDREYTTPEDIAAAVDKIADAVAEADRSLYRKIEEVRATLERQDTTLSEDIEALRSLTEEVRKEVLPLPEPQKIDEGALVDRVLSRIEIPELEKYTPDTAEDIRNKLELLDGDERLDKSAIKGLEEFLKENTRTGDDGITRVIGANRPLYELIDVNLSGLQTGDTIVWDGVQWVPYSAPADPQTAEILSTTTVNLASTGATTLYTVPAGKKLVITSIVLRPTEATDVSSPAKVGVGVAAGEDDVWASTTLTGFINTTKVYKHETMGAFYLPVEGDAVKMGVDTAAN